MSIDINSGYNYFQAASKNTDKEDKDK